ncbi:MAG: alanine racemase [Synergistaceae bacterium]|jgi:alanine racemase|nr:alanine racemase [Synergistaceae bacterium]
MERTGNSFVEIDLRKVRRNMDKIRLHVGPDVTVLPVLKANACGHGLVEMARFLTVECGVARLAVAQVREARQLREAGITLDIMVLGGLPEDNIPYAVQEDLITPLFRVEYARTLSRFASGMGKSARVHIKIDTGLGRIGVRGENELTALLKEVGNLPSLQVEGVFTHFSEAEIEDPSFTEEQIARFDAAVARIRSSGFDLKYVHASNTPSTVRFAAARYNMVRTGLLWLGYDPCMDRPNRLDLETTLEWRAFITNINAVSAGTRLGYWRGFTAERDSKIAIGSFGYGDGYLEDLGKKGGCVLIRGRRAPLISVCMDQTFIDVTDIDGVSVGDTITIIGHDGAEKIDALDLEQITHNSYVFYLCNINGRPVKTYLR